MATPTAPPLYAAATGQPLRFGVTAAPPPPPPPPAPGLTLSAPTTGTVGVTATGLVSNTGSSPAGWSVQVDQNGLAVSPSSGTLAGGQSVPISLLASTVATFLLTLVNGSGGAVSGSPRSFVAAGATPPPPPPPPPSPGTTVATLQVVATGAGTHPYAAAVVPRPGQVPAGSTLRSTDDAAMRASIVSTYPDGSAALVVVAGSTTVTTNQVKSLTVQTSTASAGTALTAAAIGAAVASVSVDFGPYGVATRTDFSTPARVWWANERVIHAQYFLPAPSPGTTALEAVLYVSVHADGRARVRVVGENCRMNSANPVRPDGALYTSAVVTVNGTVVATVPGKAVPVAGDPEGAFHSSFRAWMAETWIGGDPGLRVTQLHTELQQHPLLWKMARSSTFDMSGYASDAYTPWSTGRHRATGMGAGGDHPSIGPLPMWEAHFLQSGDVRAARAVQASALAVLSYNVNYRDTATGLVPTIAQLGARNLQVTTPGNPQYWPQQTNPADARRWELAHHPACGLMAFIVDPDALYIELAQKVAFWNSAWGNLTGDGVFGDFAQTRGRAWGVRSLLHATFLSPDGMAWKAAGLACLQANVAAIDAFRTDPKAVLGLVWKYLPNRVVDDITGQTGFQNAQWEHTWLANELHKLASTGVLSGSAQTAVNTLADWAVDHAHRWVNEQHGTGDPAIDGGWRYIPNKFTWGRDGATIDSLPNYGQQAKWWYAMGVPQDNPSGPSGPWMWSGDAASRHSDFTPDTGGTTYAAFMWDGLRAAYERNRPGAAAARAIVEANITNLPAWLDGFGADPRHGSEARNYVSSGLSSGTATGSYDSGTQTWTPGKDGSGVITAASWGLVPRGQWSKIAGSRMDALDSVVKAAIPTWADKGAGSWDSLLANYSSCAMDPANGRWWFFGGGHALNSNNGVYGFSVYRGVWEVECLPSDPARWSSTYIGGISGGSTTYSVEAQARVDAQVAAGTWSPINGSYYDESIWDLAELGGSAGTIGLPLSRHTYSALTYAPDKNELVMVCRRLWRYSLSLRRWIYKRVIKDARLGNDMGENGLVMYDEATGEVLASAVGSAGVRMSAAFNLTTETWNNNFTAAWGYWDAFATTRHGRFQVTVRNPGDNKGGAVDYAKMDLDVPRNNGTIAQIVAPIVQSGLFQYAGGMSAADLDPGYYMPSLTFVASLGRYWYLTRRSNATQGWYQIDPTTTPWTMSPLAFSGAFPNVPDTIGSDRPWTGHKLMYVPALDAVFLAYRGSVEVWVYKN